MKVIFIIATLMFSHGAEVTTDHIFNSRGRKTSEAMLLLEVYHPTKDNTRGVSSPLLLSEPVPLKTLCREVLRKTLRTLTGGRTIQPVVASLENSGELDQDCGNFLVCDLSGSWREKMVNIGLLIFLFQIFQYFHHQAANLVKLEVKSVGALGIDLGASLTCVGVVRDGKVEIIPNDLGQKTTPSYIGWRDHPTRKYHLEMVIGDPAKDQVDILLVKLYN